MFIYHIVKFCIAYHRGGASLLNTQMNIRFRKTRIFDLKIAYECDKRPSIAPPPMYAETSVSRGCTHMVVKTTISQNGP